jgi:hypothetical protein
LDCMAFPPYCVDAKVMAPNITVVSIIVFDCGSPQ